MSFGLHHRHRLLLLHQTQHLIEPLHITERDDFDRGDVVHDLRLLFNPWFVITPVPDDGCGKVEPKVNQQANVIHNHWF